MISIRTEQHADHDAVRQLNNQAFGQATEGRIIDKLRKVCDDTLSLVAISDDKILGHIFFSPVSITRQGSNIIGMGLGPMAVLPEYQYKGIGSLLVNEGIKQITEMDIPYIIVLGHAQYYPRFGFQPASDYGISPPWPGIPDEAFMIRILDTHSMKDVAGIAHYRPEFDESV